MLAGMVASLHIVQNEGLFTSRKIGSSNTADRFKGITGFFLFTPLPRIDGGSEKRSFFSLNEIFLFFSVGFRSASMPVVFDDINRL